MKKEDFLREISSYCIYEGDFKPHFVYWYPIYEVKAEVSAVAYDLDLIYKQGGIGQIEAALSEMGIGEVISLQNQEGKEEEKLCLAVRLYEADESGYNFPWYAENYYYDETKSWLIYVSHEGTITFAGARLVQTAREKIDAKYICKR